MISNKNEFKIGEVEKMDWKLSMSTSSSSCKNLDTPIVTLKLTLKNDNDERKYQSMELTIPEFQNFSNQLKEARSVLLTS